MEKESINDYRFKLVVDYSYGAASTVMPNLFSKFGADVLAVNPYFSKSAGATSIRSPAPNGSPAGQGIGRPPRGDQSIPTASGLTIVDDIGRVSSPTPEPQLTSR